MAMHKYFTVSWSFNDRLGFRKSSKTARFGLLQKCGEAVAGKASARFWCCCLLGEVGAGDVALCAPTLLGLVGDKCDRQFVCCPRKVAWARVLAKPGIPEKWKPLPKKHCSKPLASKGEVVHLPVLRQGTVGIRVRNVEFWARHHERWAGAVFLWRWTQWILHDLYSLIWPWSWLCSLCLAHISARTGSWTRPAGPTQRTGTGKEMSIISYVPSQFFGCTFDGSGILAKTCRQMDKRTD